MKTITARNDLGFCGCGCGIRIEDGEQAVIVAGAAMRFECYSRGKSAARLDHWRQDFLFSDAQHEVVERAREAVTGASSITFDGVTILPVDVPRLANQIGKVFELMRDGRYRTLDQIAVKCDCLQTSAGARLRDLRKPRFGSHDVVSRRVADSEEVLYEYKLIVNETGVCDGNERRAA